MATGRRKPPNDSKSQSLGFTRSIQHEDIILGNSKKSDFIALISKRRESAPSKSTPSKKIVSSTDEPIFKVESDESDEDIKRLDDNMVMLVHDIQKLKSAKGYNKYRPSEKGMMTVTIQRRSMRTVTSQRRNVRTGTVHKRSVTTNIVKKRST